MLLSLRHQHRPDGNKGHQSHSPNRCRNYRQHLTLVFGRGGTIQGIAYLRHSAIGYAVITSSCPILPPLVYPNQLRHEGRIGRAGGFFPYRRTWHWCCCWIGCCPVGTTIVRVSPHQKVQHRLLGRYIRRTDHRRRTRPQRGPARRPARRPGAPEVRRRISAQLAHHLVDPADLIADAAVQPRKVGRVAPHPEADHADLHVVPAVGASAVDEEAAAGISQAGVGGRAPRAHHAGGQEAAEAVVQPGDVAVGEVARGGGDVPDGGVPQRVAQVGAVFIGGAEPGDGEGLVVVPRDAVVAIEPHGGKSGGVGRGGQFDEEKVVVDVGAGGGPPIRWMNDSPAGADGLSLSRLFFVLGVGAVGDAQRREFEGTLTMRGRQEDVGGDEGGGAGVIIGAVVGPEADQVGVVVVRDGGAADDVLFGLRNVSIGGVGGGSQPGQERYSEACCRPRVASGRHRSLLLYSVLADWFK